MFAGILVITNVPNANFIGDLDIVGKMKPKNAFKTF
jgi:hypothetical protein